MQVMYVTGTKHQKRGEHRRCEILPEFGTHPRYCSFHLAILREEGTSQHLQHDILAKREAPHRIVFLFVGSSSVLRRQPKLSSPTLARRNLSTKFR